MGNQSLACCVDNQLNQDMDTGPKLQDMHIIRQKNNEKRISLNEKDYSESQTLGDTYSEKSQNLNLNYDSQINEDNFQMFVNQNQSLLTPVQFDNNSKQTFTQNNSLLSDNGEEKLFQDQNSNKDLKYFVESIDTNPNIQFQDYSNESFFENSLVLNSEKKMLINEFGDDLNYFAWDLPEDSDEEIIEFSQNKNKYEIELGIKFSKNGIIQFLENIIETESPFNQNDKKIQRLWEQKLDSKGIKLFIKKGGSQFDSQSPFVRTEITFEKVYKLDRMLKCIYLPEHTLKHDKNLQSNQTIEMRKGVKCATYQYCQNKKQMTVNSRDFYCKGFSFYHNQKYYRYSSSVTDSEIIDQKNPDNKNKRQLPDDKTVRGITILNCGIFQRNSEGKIVGSTLSQSDIKMKVPDVMLNNFVPNAAKQWHSNIILYYQKNFK